jgi:hypothetical protein
MNNTLEPRYGTVIISDQFIAQNPHDVMQAMARMIVIRCEHRYATQDFIYTAWSPDFEIDKGICELPRYDAHFEMIDGEAIFIGFKKAE